MKQSARTVIMCRKFVVERLWPVAGAEAKSLCTQTERRLPTGVTYWLINRTDMKRKQNSSSRDLVPELRWALCGNVVDQQCTDSADSKVETADKAGQGLIPTGNRKPPAMI
jgi:hypothetical protein